METHALEDPEPPSAGLQLDVQCASTAACPSHGEFATWIALALAEVMHPVELTIRLVDEQESAELNQTYRRKSGPTNVLAFPFEAPPGITLPLLGDLVICAPLVACEAVAQGKPEMHHWAHLAIHGTLHLLGYDHLEAREAQMMEDKEREYLKTLSIPDPYEAPLGETRDA
ncbi:MAG: rRNA maturation RNase YbeY [Gammaproteobacteria bacterium]|nr:rRNA maturation RNase YbeY [Gammaproteobacteria bacterium]